MTPIDSSPRPSPVTGAERIEVLDMLRGFALFGIIASNMRAFNGPMSAYFDHSLMWQDWPNRIAQMFVDVFISGKFVTLFSFMFGIGFAIQMDRAEVKGFASRAFYIRRVFVLLLIGLAHMFLVWWGDILTVYAALGFVLFLFRNKSQKTILLWSGILYSWPWVVAAGFTLASAAGLQTPAPPPHSPAELQRLLDVYSTGTYIAIFRERLKDVAVGMTFTVFYGPRLLGIFLFGLWVWRQGILKNLAAFQDLLRRCQQSGLVIGIFLNIVTVAVAEIWHPNPAHPTALAFLHGFIASLALPAMSLCYAATIGLLYLREEWIPRLRPFGAVGRTALTNYLMQSIICTTLYYGYGFGLYGKVGPLPGLLVAILIYGAQMAISVWWMHHFSYGPMEWLWRTLTYGSLRRAGSQASPWPAVDPAVSPPARTEL
jgi:uncharacterized protein